MPERRRKIYNLLTIVGCCMVFAATSGIGANCRGIFYEPVASGLQVSLSSLTLYVTIYGITAAVSMPLSCKLFRKSPTCLFLLGMAVLYAGSEFMMGYAVNVYHFYILGAIQGVPGGFLIFYLMQYIICRWFPEKSGTVLGFVLMFSGISGMLINPLASLWIQQFGWQQAYRILGAIIFSLCMPAAVLLRKSPAERGFAPETEPEAAVRQRTGSATSTGKTTPLTIGKLLTYTALVCLLSATAQYLPKYALDAGQSAAFGALLVSFAMAGNLIGKITLGILNDRLFAKYATVICAAAVCAGYILTYLGKAPAAMLAGAFAIGAILAMISLQTPLLFRSFCDSNTYAWIYPIVCSCNVVLCSSSQTVISVLSDRLGGYRQVMLLGAAVMAACIITVLSLRPPAAENT